jgi:integrase
LANPSYLARRPCGSYLVQVRLSPGLAKLLRRTHFKTSLGTHDPGLARERSRRIMSRIEPYVRAPDIPSMGRKIWNDMRLELRLGQTRDGSRYLDRQLIEQVAREFMTKVEGLDIDHAFDLFPFGKTFLEFCQLQEKELAAFRQTERGQILLAPDIEPRRADNAENALQHAPELAAITSDLSAFGVVLKQILATIAPVQSPKETIALPAHPNSPALKFTDAARQFVEFERRQGKAKSREDKTIAILDFVDAYLDQPQLSHLTDEVLEQVDEALGDIPNVKGFSSTNRQGLFHRYKTALEHNERCALRGRADGWSDRTFTRMSISAVEGRFHTPLNAFFKWARERRLSSTSYRFHKRSGKLNSALPRDALSDQAALAIINLPIFTGCAGPTDRNRWKPGRCLVQGHIYWTLLLLTFTGMRTGEAVRLRTDRIKEGEGFYFIDLRPFDASQGRVSLEEAEGGKTENAARLIPIHPLLIDLGLLEWLDLMVQQKSERLFPQWKPPLDKHGEPRWADPVTKLWRSVRKHARLIEKNISAYSLRHLFADWLDRALSNQRTRNRIVGHVDRSSEADTYGSKSFMAPEVAAQITELDNPVIREIAAVLSAAKYKADKGELKLMRTTTSTPLSRRTPGRKIDERRYAAANSGVFSDL